MLPGQLRKYGMNTLGNWSDERLLGTTGMPYVTSLPRFPGQSRIFSGISRTCSVRNTGWMPRNVRRPCRQKAGILDGGVFPSE